jgi:hypothetical protein
LFTIFIPKNLVSKKIPDKANLKGNATKSKITGKSGKSPLTTSFI